MSGRRILFYDSDGCSGYLSGLLGRMEDDVEDGVSGGCEEKGKERKDGRRNVWQMNFFYDGDGCRFWLFFLCVCLALPLPFLFYYFAYSRKKPLSHQVKRNDTLFIEVMFIQYGYMCLLSSFKI